MNCFPRGVGCRITLYADQKHLFFKKLNQFLNSAYATIVIGACNIIYRIHTVQSWACDNVTALSGHKLFVIAFLLYSLWLLYLDTETANLNIFLIFLVPETLLRCRKAKLMSPAQLCTYILYIYIKYNTCRWKVCGVCMICTCGR